jgi:hypothetical protein
MNTFHVLLIITLVSSLAMINELKRSEQHAELMEAIANQPVITQQPPG